jgi:hypothetical protein
VFKPTREGQYRSVKAFVSAKGHRTIHKCSLLIQQEHNTQQRTPSLLLIMFWQDCNTQEVTHNTKNRNL